MQRVLQGGEELREFLLRPVEDIAGKKASSGTEFEDFNLRRAVERLPHLFKLAGEKASEDGVDVGGGVEISGFAELAAAARVVAQNGIVETDFHVARKRDWTVIANLLFDLLAERQVDTPLDLDLLESLI